MPSPHEGQSGTEGRAPPASQDRVTDAPHEAAEEASSPSGSVPAGAAPFTPGPWRAEGVNVFGEVEGEQYIATAQMLRRCPPTSTRQLADTRDETYANARLIAAAPELYEACERGLELAIQLANEGPHSSGAELDNIATDIRVIEAALSKARGES